MGVSFQKVEVRDIMSKKRSRRRPYDAFLPASSCYQELYKKLDMYAEARGLSLADVVRQAVEFFLSDDFQKVEAKTRKVESNQ